MFRHAFVSVLTVTFFALPSLAIDDALVDRADKSIDKGIAYLRKAQAADGSWSAKTGPAVTALILNALIDRPDIKANDPTVQKALKFILSKAKEDGSIHDGILMNYNTAICLSALSRLNDDPKAAPVIKKGLDYLRKTQYAAGMRDEKGNLIGEDHAFFGGYGYGKHGRPDGSNTQITIQAFYDNNIDCSKDPAMKRALMFTARLQGSKANDLFKKGEIAQDGGAVYATSINKDHVGVPQSQADPDGKDEALAGRKVSNLRTYGSMTYAMFKTYIYARLEKDDQRVKDALKWVSNNYTFEHNPGMPEAAKLQGFYYYVLTAARALDAFGENTITTADGKKHQWRDDVVKKLISVQREDGSWLNEADRWMEGDANMITAFALLSLEHAAK